MKIKAVHKLKMPYQFKIKGINWILNRVTKIIENYIIRKANICSCVQRGINEIPIIVSLTTYPERNEKVQWTIKSLLNQNVKIDRLIIWLAEEQYPDKKIPNEIQQYIEYGLEVRFCDDLKSHKKYYYTMLENRNSIVITVDDDVIYPEDTMEKLLKMHHKYPDAIICNQGRLIATNQFGFESYTKWTVNIPRKTVMPSYLILPVGEGGVLYPRDSLDQDVFSQDVFKTLAFSADDLWLKFMAVKNKRRTVITTKVQRSPSEVIVRKNKDFALNRDNVYKRKNDYVIKNLNSYYKEVFQIIQTDIKVNH